MKSNRSLSLFFWFWLPLTVLAFTAPFAKADPTTQEITSAVDTIVTVLRPYVSPLDREMMTFHYATETETPQIQSDTQILDMAGATADQFFNLGYTTDDMQGPGYYVAIDPHSTRSYGGDKPLLFATPIRKGAAILSFDSNPHKDENAPAHDFEVLSNMNTQLACSPPKSARFRFFTLELFTAVFRNSSVPACRRIIADAYRKLGIDAILYSYKSDQFASDCRHRGGALNVIRKEALASTGNALFWSNGMFSNPTLAKLVA